MDSRQAGIESRRRILEAMPGRVQDLSKRTGLVVSTIYHHMQKIRKQVPKVCFIKRWKHTKGQQSPVWARGNFPDAPKPPVDPKSWDRKYHRNVRAPREKELRARKRAARESADLVAKAGDPLVLALFGKRVASSGRQA